MKAIENVKKNNSTLHIMGILQDAGVHGMNTHLYALLELAKKNDVQKVNIHLFTDGRDADPKSAQQFLDKLNKIKEIGEISTVIGRYYAMDRDNRWERTKKAYDCLVFGEGRRAVSTSAAIKMAYENKETDEFISPTIIEGYKGMNENDSIILFNFRLDRARQLTKCFASKQFTKFRRREFNNVFVCMATYYHELLTNSKENVFIAFEHKHIPNVLGDVLSKNNLKQLRIAETEKYAHVTYFFNGQEENPFPNEERILIPSPKVATYDLKPEMSANEITNTLLKEISKYDVVIVNFANADMVGHTGDLKAAIKAVEVIDECLGKILEKVRDLGGVALITADHGNAEDIINDRITSHSTNNVEFIVYNYSCRLVREGLLANVAPTILQILGIEKPKEMTEDSLILE